MKPKNNEAKRPKRTKEVLKKAVAGVLIPAVLMPSCSPYFLDEEDVVKVNDPITGNLKNSDAMSIAVQINLGAEDLLLLGFLDCLVADILENPEIAKKFAENPRDFAQTYGVQNLDINFDDHFWQLIIALGDKDLHDAAKNQDIQLFFSLCEQRGLIAKLKKSEIVKYLDATLDGIEDPEMVGIVAAVVVAVVGAGAGIAVGAAAIYAAVACKDWKWADDRGGGGDSSAMIIRDPYAYQLWVLKNGKENTYTVLTEYQEKIVNDCVDVLFEYFPEKAEKIDIEKWRQLITINMPKG